MYSFTNENTFFYQQIIWLLVSTAIFFAAVLPDYRFLRSGNSAFFMYVMVILLLIAVLLVGDVVLGAQRRIDFGFFSLQPSDPAKLVLIVVLAKYFAKRHELIGDIKHIIVSGLYALLIVGLVIIQPDFGSAVIIATIWFGMLVISGIRFRHILLVFSLAAIMLGVIWQFVFLDYQKQRVVSFLDPLSDLQGTGYNAYQSMVAVGSGELFGKGVGYGTQSKLLYLPEFETDFIFAAFAEEWGFLGVIFLFGMFGVVVWRIIRYAILATSNFVTLYSAGVAIFLIIHLFVHTGINIGLLPVTGTTIPFLSYGGSHLVTEFLAVALVVAMAKNRRVVIPATNSFEHSVLENSSSRRKS